MGRHHQAEPPARHQLHARQRRAARGHRAGCLPDGAPDSADPLPRRGLCEEEAGSRARACASPAGAGQAGPDVLKHNRPPADVHQGASGLRGHTVLLACHRLPAERPERRKRGAGLRQDRDSQAGKVYAAKNEDGWRRRAAGRGAEPAALAGGPRRGAPGCCRGCQRCRRRRNSAAPSAGEEERGRRRCSGHGCVAGRGCRRRSGHG
mmetsp:Transcript_86771/g.273831  ORF Transcript_86771/g.273831 Transcript_86771/m.273831 type:complete len:207 (-) Transcript_86771:200-820(-)